MKSAFVFVLLVSVFSVAVIAQEYIDASSTPGFDVIFTNDTSFLDQLDHTRGAFFVAGQGHIFEVNEYPVFNISYLPVFKNRHSFLDFKTFRDTTGNTWAIGSVANQYNRGNDTTEYPGLNYPLSITGGHPDHPVEIIEPPPGFYMMSAVTVDNSTTGKTIAYFVGWHQHWNASEGVNFTLIRTVVNIDNALAVPPILPIFEYNHTGVDRAYLHGEDFVAYSRDFKPWLFHSELHYHLVIVDPATNSIFRVLTPTNLSEPLVYNETINRLRLGWWYGGQITGAAYDPMTGYAYVGIAGEGTLPGHIVVVEVFNMTIVKNFTLGPYQSNPKSLQLNGPGVNATALYIGLYGTREILKVDLGSWTVTSLTTLSPWLTNVFAMALGRDHLYFITNEQHSKVARVPLVNFCATNCDYRFGFCNNTQCQCIWSFLQIDPTDKDKRTCIPAIAPTPAPSVPPTSPPTTTATSSTIGTSTSTTSNQPTKEPTKAPDYKEEAKKDHGGEVALGILFALATIIAAVGWFLLYKARGGGVYASLINRT